MPTQARWLNLKLKTNEPEGLIFMYFSQSQTPTTLSMINGKLVVMSLRDSVVTVDTVYDDSEWHDVTVNLAAELGLRVKTRSDINQGIPSGVLFLGGINFNAVTNMTYKASTITPFRGCIAKVTVDGAFPDWLGPVIFRGATFHKCEMTTPVSTTPPTLPPTTTTLQPTTLRPIRGCTLAWLNEGFRFGTREDSRIEYAQLPHGPALDLTVTLCTSDKHGGLIFYAKQPPEQFLALYMKDGQIHFTFNCVGDNATIISQDTYIDSEWHSVTASRSNDGYGRLTVDNQVVGETNTTCKFPLPLAAPYYYGGLRNNDSAKTHFGDFYQPFKGCMKGLIMNGFKAEIQKVYALQYSDNVEDGVYFGPSTKTTSNYLMLSESGFHVGINITISMDIKPRNATGLLFSVHGMKDFLTLELMEGEVIVRVENGLGEFHASYDLLRARNTSLCNGNWHTIQVLKFGNTVSVGVDNHFSDTVVRETSEYYEETSDFEIHDDSGLSTDTRSAIFIGGHTRAVSRLRGIRCKYGYTGCIRNIKIRDQPVKIPLTAAHENVHIGACPVD
ncbi:laminin subunit alpha-4-like [Cydia pomonella]|uniref:laminin subunit alpha-4-like n=1 Tax=Cydia pomonella TaxID=82600 RepID=UPI002ADD3C04|nr:laminin subunit alpha-4-like [Cydia pomonella]